MDHPEVITAVEWFFGYGGNHLGLKRVLPNLRLIAACEIEGYAVANMVAKMEAGLLDSAPIWSDCKTFPCEVFSGLVDIFIASYPCQPFSSAGNRNGGDDPRHLWPFVRRAVEIIRPRICFFENVEGHVSLGLREVLTELALLGYRVENGRGEPTWGIFSAAEVGAPHNRKRVFIMAVRNGESVPSQGRECFQNIGAEIRPESDSGRIELADSESRRNGTIPEGQWNERQGTSKPDRAGKAIGNPADIRRKSIRANTGKNRGSKDARKQRRKAPIRLREPSGASDLSRDGLRDGIRQQGDGQAVTSKLRREQSRKARGWRSGLADSSGVGQADANQPRSQGRQCGELQECSGELPARSCGSRPIFWPEFVARPNEPQKPFEPPRVIEIKRGLGGGVNGRSANVDRLRLLGNGVYPATASKAWEVLSERFKQNP